MMISTHVKEQAVVIDLGGQIDAEGAYNLRKRIWEMAEEGKSNFVINFHRTSYVDGIALGFLVSTLKELRMNYGDLRLINVQPKVRELLEISLLDRFFPLGNPSEGVGQVHREEEEATA